MAPIYHPLTPNTSTQPISIRKIYIQNLVDLLYACLARGEVERAKRAWSILIRCREVDWKSRWRWGLALMSASEPDADMYGERRGPDVEQWLRSLRVTISQQEKPAVLHALILHLIRSNQPQEALDELETYLTSYPYLLSGTLHTYAGLLAFYLAQSLNMRIPFDAHQTEGTEEIGLGSMFGMGVIGSADPPHMAGYPDVRRRVIDPPNQGLLRQARGWFVKALEIAQDPVASEFIRIIDTGDTSSARSDTFSERGSSIPPNHTSMRPTDEMHELDQSDYETGSNDESEDEDHESETDSEGSTDGLDIAAFESDGGAGEDETVDSLHEEEDD